MDGYYCIRPRQRRLPCFCFDYWKFNAVQVHGSYTFSRVNECIDSLGEAKVFSTLNANSGYWRMEVDERDHNKTSITSQHGLYRLTRMSSGLNNAQVTFQEAMDVILAAVRCQPALVYLDDTVLLSKSLQYRIELVRHEL